MRRQIQQSKIAIAELVAKLQAEQAKLERMEARVEKYEEAIALLQEAIAEDPLLWGEVSDRLQPAWLQDAEDLKDRILRALYPYSCHVTLQELCRLLDREEDLISSRLQRLEPDYINSSSDGYQINIGGIRYVEALEATLSAAPAQVNEDPIALPPTIIPNGNGSAKLGCAKQKLAKEWTDLVTLWGCTAEVTKAESFSDKEIKWEVEIANITRSQLETLAKTHTSPHAEVPTPGRKVERDCLQSPSSEQIFDAECLPEEAIADSVNSTTVEEVLDGASPLNLSAAQMDELEDVLVGVGDLPTPSIDNIADEKPSAYAEEMALKINPGTKLKSFPFPEDPKHKSSKKRTGVVRRIERDGAYIYAFVAELTERGTDSRHTAYYNLEAVEILEDAPTVELAIGVAEEPAARNGFNHFEPFDPIEIALQSDDVLGGLEAEIIQFLKEKAAQADLYEGNDPNASFSEICAAIKLDFVEYDRPRTALENLESRGLILGTGILGKEGRDRWQIAPEKPSQDHYFKVGDRVTICGDSKGEDLIGKSGTLTAVSLTGCVLYLDGEDENNRLFFCKEDLSPCSTFSQAA